MSDFIPINSSAISGMEYDEATSTLTVHFTQGTAYTYSGVPPSVAAGLHSAPSPGKYFNSMIRPNFGHTQQGPYQKF